MGGRFVQGNNLQTVKLFLEKALPSNPGKRLVPNAIPEAGGITLSNYEQLAWLATMAYLDAEYVVFPGQTKAMTDIEVGSYILAVGLGERPLGMLPDTSTV